MAQMAAAAKRAKAAAAAAQLQAKISEGEDFYEAVAEATFKQRGWPADLAAEAAQQETADASVGIRVLFGQRSVSNNFSSPIIVNGKKYYTVKELAQAIDGGDVSPDDIEVQAATMDDGTSWSLSNRRNTAIVLGGKLPTNVVYRDATAKEAARLSQTSLADEGPLPSTKMAVTLSATDRAVIAVADIDAVEQANSTDAELASAVQTALGSGAGNDGVAEGEAEDQEFEEELGE